MRHSIIIPIAVGFLMAASLARAQAPDNPAPAQTEMQKWIAATDAQWQAAYKRDVTDVREAEMDKVKLQYLTLLEDAIGTASKASDLDGAVALRNEQKRFAEANVIPEQDIGGEAPCVKQARAAIRAQIVKVEKDSAARAKALLAKYDAALAQAQGQLTQVKRLDDALLVKAKREEVAAAWSTPTMAASLENPKTSANVATGGPVPTAPASTANAFHLQSFFNKLKAAAGNPRIPKNSLSKRERGKAFEDIPKEGAYLVGFELTKGDWFGAPLFHSLQPIYMTAAGKLRGEVHGNPGHGAFTVEAREGYAVGELSFLDGNFFWSLQITFMKVDAFHKNLDRKDSYTTELYGDLSRHKGWQPKKVAGDGSPIIGIFGFAGEEMNALGVIQAQ